MAEPPRAPPPDGAPGDAPPAPPADETTGSATQPSPRGPPTAEVEQEGGPGDDGALPPGFFSELGADPEAAPEAGSASGLGPPRAGGAKATAGPGGAGPRPATRRSQGARPTLTVPDRRPLAGRATAPAPPDLEPYLPVSVEPGLSLPPWWPVAAALLVLAAAVAGWGAWAAANRAVPVFVADLEAVHHYPILSPGGALTVRPRSETWLAFKVGGQLVDSLPPVGTRVARDQVLGRLQLGPQVQQGMRQARAALAASQPPLARARKDVQHFDGLLETAAAQLRALAPDGRADGHRAAAKRAKERLHHLRERYAIPQKRLRQAAEAHAAAQARVSRLEAQVAGTALVAPLAGRISGLHDPGHGPIIAGRPMVAVADDSAVRLIFRIEDRRGLERGHEATVMAADDPPRVGRVMAVEEVAGSFEVAVDLPDPQGVYIARPPETFRLVLAHVETAFLVRAGAVMGSEQHASVWWLQGATLARQPVQILAPAKAGKLLLFDVTGRLPPKVRLVTGRLDDQPLSTLAQDTRLEQHMEAHPADDAPSSPPRPPKRSPSPPPPGTARPR